MNKQEFKIAQLAYIVLAIFCTVALIICYFIAPAAVVIFIGFSFFLWGIVSGFVILNESGLLCFADKDSRREEK